MIVVFIAVNILCQILPNLIAMNINYSKYGSELLFEILFDFGFDRLQCYDSFKNLHIKSFSKPFLVK